MIRGNVRFSARTAWDRAETELTRVLRERRAAGLPVFDLTGSNPTQCGFIYDESAILRALENPDALKYDPDPRGIERARQTVAAYYGGHGASVNTERIFLTTSTSEAYSFLFRLLCDPGDEVLIAQPSYPLFDFLAALDDVRLAPYPLFYDYGWHLDTEALRQRITPRTRAIALVHPNNPTGHFTKAAERGELENICREHDLALVVDEVFLDYSIGGQDAGSFAAGEHPGLTFVLSGLSKIAALPQMKAAWIAAFGPEAELREALSRMEIIADTFLSMSAPIQHALPHWMEGRGDLQRQIRQRVAVNLRALDDLLAAQQLVTRLAVEAGWCVPLRIPAIFSGEEAAVHLVRGAGVAVHPGHFYGFDGGGWLVISLLTPEEDFRRGVQAILQFTVETDSTPVPRLS